MLSTYCQECGSKNEYRLSKPKFCNNCGSSLDGSEIKKQKPSEGNVRLRQDKEDIDDLDGTDIYEVPYVENLSYEIEMPKGSFSLGDLFKNVESQSNPEKPKPKKRGRPKKK